MGLYDDDDDPCVFDPCGECDTCKANGYSVKHVGGFPVVHRHGRSTGSDARIPDSPVEYVDSATWCW